MCVVLVFDFGMTHRYIEINRTQHHDKSDMKHGGVSVCVFVWVVSGCIVM